MDDNQILLDRFSAAWSEKDAEKVANLFAPDGVYFASIGPEPGHRAVGRVAIKKLVAAMFAQDAGAQSQTSAPIMMEDAAFWTWQYDLPDGTTELGCDLLRLEGGYITLKDAYRKVRQK